MIFEFQISRPKLENLLKNRLLAWRPCVSKAFLHDDEPYYVARVTLDGTSIFTDSGTRLAVLYHFLPSESTYLLSAIEVPPLRMSQHAVAHVVSRTSLESANTGPSVLVPVPFDITFNLAMTFDEDHVPYLCATAHQVQNLDLGDPAAEQQLDDFVKQHVVSCAEVNLESLGALTKSAVPPVVNAGIALHANGERIAIRLDTSHADTSYWPGFYTGAFPLLAVDHEWAVLVPADLILPPIVQHAATSIQKAESDGIFSKDSGPDGAWTSDGGGPHAAIAVAGELIDACIDIDVDLEVTLGITFSVPGPNVLRATLTMAWDSNDAELFLCEFVAATVWPVVGAVMLSEDKIEWWMFLAGLAVGPVVIFTSLIGYLSSGEPASHIPSFGGWVEVSETERYQDVAFPTSLGGLVGGITLDTVSASGVGLILAGSLASTDAVLRDLTASVSGFGGWPDAWTLARSCGRARYEVVADIILGPLTAPNQSPPLVPIRVCHVQVLDDPLGQYADVSRPSEFHVKITVALPAKPGFYPPYTPYPEPKPANMYYPCKVLILTTDGARLITIPPPPPPPPPIEDPVEVIALKLWRLIHCTRYDSIWDHLHMLNPEWLIDPPPEEEVAQSWAVTVSGMRQGDAFVLRDGRGSELVTAFADASGIARATAIVENARGEGITMARPGMAMPASEFRVRSEQLALPDVAPRQSVSVKQTLLVRAAVIALDGALDRLAFVQFRGVPTVFAATDAGIAAYGLGEPSRPQRSALRPQSARLEVASTWVARRLAGVGECGVGRVRDAVRRGRFTYLLRDRCVEVLDEHGCSIRAITVADSTSIATAGELIVIGTEAGLAIFDSAEAPGWRSPSRVPDADVHGVVPARLPHARRAVYVRGRGHGGRVLDLRDPARPMELARHSQRPWYVDGGQLGRLLVRTADDDRHVVVYRVGASHVGFERAPTVQEIHNAGR